MSANEKERREAQKAERRERKAAAAAEQEKKRRSYRRRVVIIVAVLVVLIIGAFLINSDIFYTKTTALTVGDTKYSPAEVSYFYRSTYNTVYQNLSDQFGSMVSMLIDNTKPLSEQPYPYDVTGEQTWAENMDLMFTFRGIPCLYYGSEVEFQKGEYIDKGTIIPLSESGRAYYGDYLEGDVSASDFSRFTASGAVADTLEKPLCKHLSKLNAIRRAIPALQKGQYTVDSKYVSGNMAYIRRYTDSEVDSLALVAISGSATFKGIPNGTYIDAVTGDVQTVTNGTLSVGSLSKANMRVYVCCADGFKGISGAIGEKSTTYLK